MSDILNVINEGYCVGCGACACLPESNVQMRQNQYQQLVASPSPELSDSVSRVCPFSDKAIDETQLGRELYGEHCKWNGFLGYHLSTYVGHVSEKDFRAKGSSGGLVTWVLAELLDQGLVDAVVHVGDRQPSSEDARVAEYIISRTSESLRKHAKSRYHPVEFSKVISEIVSSGETVAIVGVPCFIKAIRLLCRESSSLNQQVKFTVSLVCGHLKSLAFAQMFGWQMGIPPDELESFDFRVKLPEEPANRYGVSARSKTGSKTSPTHKLFGSNWGHGFFKYQACDYCDDVFGETADIAIGDAWLPNYREDYRGTNVAVVRNASLQKLIEDGVVAGRLKLDEVSPSLVAESQTAGFRHRREGLVYRILAKTKSKSWVPKKRVQLSSFKFIKRRSKMFLAREQLVEASHVGFREAVSSSDYFIFERKMRPLLERYERFRRNSFLSRLFRFVLRKLCFKPATKVDAETLPASFEVLRPKENGEHSSRTLGN